MTGRDFGGALDNHLTPEDPPHDYTEDMPESELKSWLLRYLDEAAPFYRDEIINYINERKARMAAENFP